MAKRGFRWPREHLYLSSSGAHKRACLLHWLGAEVTVHRSLPVIWAPPEPEPVLWTIDAKRPGWSAWPQDPYPERFDPSGLPDG